MVRIPVKPLSLNNAYRGRRFATKELTKYKSDIQRLVPKMTIPPGRLEAHYVFGVSSKASDADNLVKCVQDALSEVYGFNDRSIYLYTIEKRDVPKGMEYIEFELRPA